MADGSSPDPVGVLTWTVHPARERPVKTALLLGFIAALLAIAYLAFGSVGYSLIALVVLAGALMPYLASTTYSLDREGVSIRTRLGTQRRTWDEFRVLRRAQGQIVLCTRRASSATDRLRACRLVLAENEPDVVRFLASVGLEGR